MKKLALCVIVEGDEKLDDLQIAVDSAASYVDEVCITTNGQETEKVKEYCAEHGFKHSHLVWRDNFAEQRNFNFAQTSDNVDYIIWLDSDDELVGGEQLREVVEIARAKNYDTVFFTYWYGCKFSSDNRRLFTLEDVELYHNRERLIKKNSYNWVGAVHETPVEHEGIDVKYTGINHLPDDPHELYQIAVLHRDATRESKKRNLERQARNRRILEKQLARERADGEADPRTILYLMKILKESEEETDLAKCIKLGEEYLEKSGWNEERATAYILISNCFFTLGQPEMAKNTLMGALDEYPHNRNIFLSLANAYFLLDKHDNMKLYMDLADEVPIKSKTAGNRNVLDLKFKKQMLKLRYYLNVDKNINKALRAAKEIYKIQPFPENKKQIEHLEDLNAYNEAARNLDEFIRYLGDGFRTGEAREVLKSVPEGFRKLPFYNRLKNKFGKPKIWGEKEICYYASLGGDHFEPWSPESLKTGIGGSETAVIKLAKYWTEMGYKVTVYGYPKIEGDYDGVTYLSYKRFNPKDRFNIFIQWRATFLADKISSKKFLVDLHDIYSKKQIAEAADRVDKFMVKSNYHRNLADNLPDEKFEVISNGI